MFGLHEFSRRGSPVQGCRFEHACGCDGFNVVTAVPLNQLRALARDEAVVVIVPVVSWPAGDRLIDWAEKLAGDINEAASIILVQEGPALHFVARHPNPEVMGTTLGGEERLRKTLLEIRQKIDGEGVALAITKEGSGDRTKNESGDQHQSAPRTDRN
jgi:hypothetical protein